MKKLLLFSALLFSCAQEPPREVICTKFESREADAPCRDAIYSIGNTERERQECPHPKQTMSVEPGVDIWFVRCTCPGRLYSPFIKSTP